MVHQDSWGTSVFRKLCVWFYVCLSFFAFFWRGGGMWDTKFLWTTTRRLRGFDWGSPESYDSHRSSNLAMGYHNWYRQSSEHRSRFILGSWKCHKAPFNLGPMPFVAQFSVNCNDRSESPFLFRIWKKTWHLPAASASSWRPICSCLNLPHTLCKIICTVINLLCIVSKVMYQS